MLKIQKSSLTIEPGCDTYLKSELMIFTEFIHVVILIKDEINRTIRTKNTSVRMFRVKFSYYLKFSKTKHRVYVAPRLIVIDGMRRV